MTSGEKLLRQLNLEKYKNVYISYLRGSSPATYVITYDSLRPNMPISSEYLKKYSNVSFYRSNEKLLPSVPMDIRRSNAVFTGNIIVYDIAMSSMTRNESIKNIKDSRQLLSKVESIYHISNNTLVKPLNKVYNGRLNELTLKDLKGGKESTISTNTMDWRKDRNKLGYFENKKSKLIDCVINEAEDSILFMFLTEATEGQSDFSKERGYNYDDPKGEVDPTTFNINRNNSKLYEIQIKFMNLKEFIAYLKTSPKNDVTKEDISYLIENMDVKVFSNSSSFHWQGYNWVCSELDISIYPTNIPSKVWMPNRFKGEFILDKHLYGLIQQISFFSQQMAQMLKSKLKERGLI